MREPTDILYNGFIYRVYGSEVGSEISSTVWICEENQGSFAPGNYETMHFRGDYRAMREAMADAECKVRAMIDGTVPGLPFTRA